MENIKKRVYFTYQDILDYLDYDGHPQFPNDKNMASSWFTDMLEDSPFEFAVYTLSEFFPDDLINDIVNALMGIVYNRHAYDYISYKDVEIDGDEEIDPEIFIKSFTPIINVINNTIPKYIPMLQQTEWASTAPITPNEDESIDESSGENHVTGQGKNRFNDTPQESGEFDDDSHTTNISENESKDDGNFKQKNSRKNVTNIGTLMNRLSELYKNFPSIILNWSNEFNQIFLKEEQIL